MKNKDWLKESLKLTKKFLDSLPKRTKVALEKERLYQEAMKQLDPDCVPHL